MRRRRPCKEPSFPACQVPAPAVSGRRRPGGGTGRHTRLRGKTASWVPRNDFVPPSYGQVAHTPVQGATTRETTTGTAGTAPVPFAERERDVRVRPMGRSGAQRHRAGGLESVLALGSSCPERIRLISADTVRLRTPKRSLRDAACSRMRAKILGHRGCGCGIKGVEQARWSRPGPFIRPQDPQLCRAFRAMSSCIGALPHRTRRDEQRREPERRGGVRGA